MRTFNNESVWDKENQEWVEIYYIDGQEVDVDTYTEQLAVEELAAEDEDIIDENCKCCNCPDNEDCVDFKCTCGCDNNEYYYENEDEECMCDECRKERFYHLLADTVNNISEVEGCPDCTMGILMGFIMEYQDMGFRVMKG